ncbi:hypothetical protein [Halobacteriaceae bacterium SHR40]|uniref:hypothetical protein n=1 Tax=Halovenus amylolytica TaxID=2500550 RepID=UPI000FE38E37
MKTAAIDIETTGTAPEDQITVMGVDIPMGSRVFLNTGERTYPEAITDRIDQDFDSVVQITAHDCEAALLEAFRSFALQRFGGSRDSRDDEFKFAAYNGETWKGGFDLPFIRTRCQSHGVGWPLHGPYIDVMAVVGDRFNVSDKSLETTYEELVGEGLTASDPFEESGEAVESWRAGNFESLLRHNVADIRRTRALVRVAEQYCSTSHFSMRSLGPVNTD